MVAEKIALSYTLNEPSYWHDHYTGQELTAGRGAKKKSELLLFSWLNRADYHIHQNQKEKTENRQNSI